MSNRSRAAIVCAVVALVIAAGAGGFLLWWTPGVQDESLKPSERSVQTPEVRDEPQKAPDRPARKVFELAVVNGQVRDIGDTIRVNQGDELELRWSSDRPMSLHLHGYDIESKVSPQSPAVMSFKASLAGRFPVSEHRHGAGHERAVLYLEVHP